MNGVLFTLVLLAALGCGVVAGAFYAFSTFVMRGLGDLPPARGIAAMQSLNVRAVQPMFMLSFIGTAVMALAAVVVALVSWPDDGGPWIVVGAGLYLVGGFGVTVMANVPRNDALAAADPDSVDGAALWARYLSEWTAWNHVRTIASLAACAALILALAV